MLRLFALALLFANGLYFAWGHGLLLPYGFGPLPQNEPQRLAQQMSPQALRLLPAAEFKRIEEDVKQEQAPKECLQAGPFDAAQSVALRQTLEQSLPAGSWVLEETPVGARWIVYMGKYAAPDLLAKKPRAVWFQLGIREDAVAQTLAEAGIQVVQDRCLMVELRHR